MKIIIPLVGSFSKEGGWRVLSELANAWIKLGHEVVFLSHMRFKEPYFPTEADILFYNNKGEISSLGSLDYSVPFGGPFPLRRALRKALDKLEADVVLATQNFTVDPVKKSSIKAKKFYYVQAYEPEFYNTGPLRYKIYKIIAQNSYKKGLSIIVNSPMYKNYKGIRSDKVIYPGLNLEIFHPGTKKSKNETLVLGSIGRTEVFKGTGFILEAFKSLREKMGNKVELHLAFGDEKWSEIDGVTMHYPNGDAQLADFYRSLDCYICAQYIQLDAVHYPVIEAMACGIPLVTTGYYPSNDRNSWKIVTKSSEAIVDKILELIDNDALARQRVDEGLNAVQEFERSLLADKMISYFVQ